MEVSGLSRRQHVVKRGVDIILAVVGISLVWWIIMIGWFVAAVETRQNGLFKQARIGRAGRAFMIWKLRTMRDDPYLHTSVTTQSDPRITRSGAFLRRTKWNELPQLFNVLMGHMSFVGPRPEVPGFADELEGDDRIVLSIRPGLTGPATLRYRNEEIVLDSVDDPDAYNVDILYPEKVRLNREYVQNYSLARDIKYVFMTVLAVVPSPRIQQWIDRSVELAPVRELEPAHLREPEPLLHREPEPQPRYAESA